MRIHIQLFSVAKEMAGFQSRTVEMRDPARAGSVVDYLAGENPDFIGWKRSLRLAVNLEYVSENHPLRDGDEVAVIPPVSGG